MAKKIIPVVIFIFLIASACSGASDSNGDLVSIQPSSNQNSTGPQSSGNSQTIPSQTIPSQTIPSQTSPSETVPSQTSPSQTVPSQTIAPPPTRTFPNSVLSQQIVTRLTGNIEADRSSVFQLADVVDGTKPVLLWFWAPH